jgi:2-polyprenyl-3-methyl-5-hydroxy-6-metoxy-1,4-benzoquinol methylase
MSPPLPPPSKPEYEETRMFANTPNNDNRQYLWQTLLDVANTDASFYHAKVRHELVDLLDKAPDAVLEIGCAAGQTGEYLKMKFPGASVVGIEPNKAAASAAQDRLDKVLVGKFEDFDLEAHGILPGTLDAVILGDVLEHTENPWRILTTLQRYLKPDAQLLVSLPNIRNIAVIDDLARGYWKYEAYGLLDITHLRFFTLREAKRLFFETGYHLEQLVFGVESRYIDLLDSYKTLRPAALDLGKVVVKDVLPQEAVELCCVQFFMRIRPGGNPADVADYGSLMAHRKDWDGRNIPLSMTDVTSLSAKTPSATLNAGLGCMTVEGQGTSIPGAEYSALAFSPKLTHLLLNLIADAKQLEHFNGATEGHTATTVEQPLPTGTPAQPNSPPLTVVAEDIDYKRAHQLMQRGDNEGALAVLQNLALRGSVRWEVFKDIGVLLLDKGEDDQAIAALRVASSLDFSSTVSLRHLAMAYGKKGEFGQLLVAIHHILKQEPDDVELAQLLIELVTGTEMQFDQFSWVTPRLDGIEERLAQAERENADLRAKLSRFNETMAFCDSVRSHLPAIEREVAIAQEIATGRASTDTAQVLSTCSALDDNSWFEVLSDSVDSPLYKGIRLPGFGDETMQRYTVGSSGIAALQEGANFYRVVKQYLERHHRVLMPTSRVLDFGCGWGRYTRFFLKDVLADNLYGADVDPAMIEVCRSSFSYGHFDTVQPFPPTTYQNDTFDLIIAYSVFSHLSPEAADAWIHEFSRILAPGGMLLVTTQGRSFIDFCREIRESGKDDHPWYLNLARSFVDATACQQAYDRGELLFAPTGGGDARPSTFYGEALVPRQHAESVWGQWLSFRDFVDDRAFLPQALIVMQKSEATS